MSNLIGVRRRLRASQPGGVAPADPRWCNIWLPSASGTNARDIVGAGNAGATSKVIGRLGHEFYAVNGVALDAALPAASTYTMLTVVTRLTSGDTLLGPCGNSYSDGGYSFNLYSGTYYTSVDPGSYTTFNGSPSLPVGVPTVVAVRHRSGSVPTLYIGGKKYAGAAAITGSLVVKRLFAISGGYTSNANHALVALSREYLSDAELAELTQSPEAAWGGVFRPISRNKRPPASASTGVVATNSQQANQASTGSVSIGASDSITLTDLANRRVYQRSGTSKSITITGTYTGSPTSIQARIVQDGTSTEVVTWATIVASPAGGTFSGAISIPQGGWYNVQVRFGNATGVTSNGTNKFGVGIVALLLGQSNMAYWGDMGTASSPALASRQSGSLHPSTTGTWAALGVTEQGHAAFANSLIAAYSIPVGILNYSVAGSPVTDWDQASDGRVQNAVKAVTDVGGAVEYILWAQGEAEALSGMTKANYKTYLAAVITNFRAQVTNGSGLSHLPFLSGTLGRENYVGVTDATMAAIREAIQEVMAEGTHTYIAASALDVYSDNVHYNGAGYATFAGRFAQTIKYLLGTVTYYRGPYISRAEVVDSTHTDVTITHRGGSDFTPTSGINGFEIDDGGSIVVPSAAVRQSATVVRLTHAALSSGSPTVRYGYGCDGGATFANAYTNPLLDNSAMALPLEQYSNIAILPRHIVTVANSAQANAASAGSITLTATAYVTAANSNQANASSVATIGQTHRVIASNSAQANAVSAAPMALMHRMICANSGQANAATPCRISLASAASVILSARLTSPARHQLATRPPRLS